MSDGLEPSLARFYAELAPLLFSEASVAQIEDRLGPSASGADNLDFYRELVGRNFGRILRDLFPAVHQVCTREHPELWPDLVAGYAASWAARAQVGAEPRDPNRWGVGFADYLAARRAEHSSEAGAYSALLEELADYQMCRYLASAAAERPTSSADGFEERVFVRGYTHPLPRFVAKLDRDPSAPLPEPRPTTVIVYRTLTRPWRVLTHAPSLAELAALARREGVDVPPAFAALATDQVDRGLAKLVELGVLTPAG